MKWSIVGLLLMGVAAAVAAAVLVATLQMDDVATGPAEVEQVPVLVAMQEIDPLRPVRAEAVSIEQMPRSEAPDSYLSSKVQVVGKLLTLPAVEGQALTPQMLLSDGIGARLAATLPSGKRAVSVSLADHAGLHELLYPGARVDVLATFRLSAGRSGGTAVSTLLLQGVQVLAVESDTLVPEEQRADGSVDVREASNTSNSSTRSSRSRKVTFAVDPPQARALQLATEHGSVSLAMRNPLDSDEGEAQVTLLSEGRLAQLASVLPPSVLAEVGAEEAETPAEPEEDPATEGEPALTLDDGPVLGPEPALLDEPLAAEPQADEARRWDVTIYRGVTSEKRTFEHPRSTPNDAARRAAAP